MGIFNSPALVTTVYMGIEERAFATNVEDICSLWVSGMLSTFEWTMLLMQLYNDDVTALSRKKRQEIISRGRKAYQKKYPQLFDKYS